MRRVFLDTNVVLDLMARREPFYVDAKAIFDRSADGAFQILLSVLSFWNIFYLMRKHPGEAKAKADLAILERLVQVVPVQVDDLRGALASSIRDLEDAMQLQGAVAAKADVIVTRDPKGFKGSPVKVLAPDAFLRQFKK
jgi:predicted nucleic acid-binding protein